MKPTHRREVVCGDFPDLEAAFTERVRELRRADPLAPLVVLVPTNLLRQHLGRSLVTRGVPHLNVRIVTVATFVRDLVEPTLFVNGQSRLPPLADELFMAQVCEKLDDDSYFRSLSDRPGLHRSLLNSIQDLKEAGADVAAFDAARKRLGDVHPTAQTKLDSLALIWKRYEGLKAKHHFVDEADQHALAGDLIAQNPRLVAATEFVVFGIYDFKRMQARLVLEMAERVPATVFFPFQPTPAWDYARPSLRMLEQADFTRVEAARNDATRSNSLQLFCDRLFAIKSFNRSTTPPATPHSALRTPHCLEIVSAPGENREAQELPRIVLDLARSDRVPFSDMGILLRTAASTRRVRDAFEEAELPACSSGGVPLAQTRAGRSFVLMLQIPREEFSRRDVMDFLTFADVDFESLAGTVEPPLALWDALSMRANIVRGREKWRPRLASLRRFLVRAADDERPRHETDREADDPSRDPATVDSLVRAVTTLFEKLDPITRCESWAELVDSAVVAFRSLTRPSGSRDAVVDAVASLARLDAIQPDVDRNLLARLVGEMLADERDDERGDSTDGPVVTALMQARGVPFRAVIVPGLIERSFPQPASLDPILLDHERARLNEAFASAKRGRGARSKGAEADSDSLAYPRLPEKANQSLEERLLFRLAVGAASERVVLTFPRIEAETGRERVPSYFLLRTLDALGDAYDSSDAVAPAASPSAPASIASDVQPGVATQTEVESASLRRSGRGRRAPAPSQLALPFDRPSPRQTVPVSVTPNATGSGVAALPVSSSPALPATAIRAPATYESLARWPGLRHVRLSELAPPSDRALTGFEFDLGAAIASVRAGTPVIAAFGAISPHFARGIDAETARWSRRQLTRFDGLVEDRSLLDELRQRSPLEHSISPSRIEDYARCPFHFFMHNLLHLEELNEPEELSRADPVAKGRLVHRILEEFLSAMKEQGRLPVTAACEADLFEIASRHFDDFETSGAAGPALTWQVEREQLEVFFRDFITYETKWQRGGFLPTRFEMKFGRDDAPADVSKEPPQIDLGDGRVLRFHGVIDRVDIHEKDRAIYVIDYKGRKLPQPGDDGTGFGTVVQLPIYALGARAALVQQGDYHSAGGCYISYLPGPPTRQLAAPTEQAESRLRDVLRTVADGIHAGLFMQYTKRGACDFCPYDRVCMGVQADIVRRKSNDEAAADFLDMKEDKPLLSGRKRK